MLDSTRQRLRSLVEGIPPEFKNYYRNDPQAQRAADPNATPAELLRLVREYPKLVWDNPVVILLSLEDPAWFKQLKTAYATAPGPKEKEVANSKRQNPDLWFADESNRFVAEWVRAFYRGLKEHEANEGEPIDVDSYRDYGADAIEDLSDDNNLFVEAYRKVFGNYPSDKVTNAWFERTTAQYHDLIDRIQSMSETGHPATPVQVKQLLIRYPRL